MLALWYRFARDSPLEGDGFEPSVPVTGPKLCLAPMVVSTLPPAGNCEDKMAPRFERLSARKFDGGREPVIAAATDEAIGKLGGGDPAPNGRIGSRRYCAPRHSVAAPNCRQG
jgi:hypothetical protein